MDDLKAEVEKRDIERRTEKATHRAVSNIKGRARGKGKKASAKKDDDE